MCFKYFPVILASSLLNLGMIGNEGSGAERLTLVYTALNHIQQTRINNGAAGICFLIAEICNEAAKGVL